MIGVAYYVKIQLSFIHERTPNHDNNNKLTNLMKSSRRYGQHFQLAKDQILRESYIPQWT